jgi:Flp pilus assembly protein TadD
LALAQGNVLSPTNSTLLDSTLSADSALSTTTTLPPTNSLATAEARIWQAIRLIPQDGETWALLGLILKKQGRFKAAMQALEVARTLDPTLGAGLFPALWQAALQAEDVQTLQALVRTYSQAHRETPLAIYYRAETLLTLGEVELARDLLIASMDQASPAILWYTLGRAYVRLEAWHEAALSLEVAKKRIAAGDDSLRFMDGEHTLEDLNLALGQAYLRAGQCAEAAPILRQMSASYPDLAPLVREAVLCQTPTPTWTPWMLSEQVTPTFTPG